MFRHLRSFLKEHRWAYLFGVLTLIGIDLLQLVTPILIGQFTDILNEGRLTQAILFRYMAYILAIAAGVALGRFTWRNLLFGVSRDLEYDLRNRFFRHLEGLSLSYFNTHKTGDLMAHATNDLNAIRMAFGPGIVMITDALFLSFMTLGLMLTRIDVRLTLVTLVPLPFIAIFVGLLGRSIRKRFKRVQEAFGGVLDAANESFSGIRIIKSFVQERYQLDYFEKANAENYEANMDLVKVYGVMFPLVQFIASLSLLIGIGYGSHLVLSDTITVGEFVTFLSFIGMLTWPMMALGWVINMLQRGAVSLERVNHVLDTTPEIKNPKHPVVPGPIEAIELENVSFTYREKTEPALDSIHLKIRRGEKVALIGRTGSGKSTLVHLLNRAMDITEGRLLINGTSIDDLDLPSLRRRFAYVVQDNFLFSDTIKENLRFAAPDLSDEALFEKARIAGIHEEILALENGYDTLLGERGINLSGGQKQRLSIARALATEADILVLDDSLSAVDTKTEKAIKEHLFALEDQTTIFIAHRISTIKEADRIYVLDEGRLIQSGDHASLLEQGGLYRDLYEHQLLEEELDTKEV
jgi:ATP-binding cassette subfamily B protein